MLFKCVKELVQNIFFRFLAASHLRMHGGVVPALKIFNVDNSVAVTVKPLESLLDD
jgi:hypothetical protein